MRIRALMVAPIAVIFASFVMPAIAQNSPGSSHTGQILRADDSRNDRVSAPPIDYQTGQPNYRQAMGFGARTGGYSNRMLQSRLADMQSSARNTFLRAQAQKEEGEDDAACKTMRKAIEKDRRYMASKKRLYPETETTDEAYYHDIEAEYCGSERG